MAITQQTIFDTSMATALGAGSVFCFSNFIFDLQIKYYAKKFENGKLKSYTQEELSTYFNLKYTRIPHDRHHWKNFDPSIMKHSKEYWYGRFIETSKALRHHIWETFPYRMGLTMTGTFAIGAGAYFCMKWAVQNAYQLANHND